MEDRSITAGELIKYLQNFPEDSEFRINVIDCHQERKYGFPINRLALIIGEDYPVMFLDIDTEQAVDVTREEDEDEALDS